MRVIVGLALICGAALVFVVLITGSMVMYSAPSTVQDESITSWQSNLANYVDSGTVLLIGTNYSLFFVLLLFNSCIIILKPLKSLVPACNKEARIQASVGYGMAALVGISYGLSVVFHVYHKDEMKF